MKKFLWFLQMLATSICGISIAQLSIALFQGDLAQARASFIIAVVMSIPLWVTLTRLLRSIDSDKQQRFDGDIRAIRNATERVANSNRRAAQGARSRR